MTTKATKAKSPKSAPPKTDKKANKAETAPTKAGQRKLGPQTLAKTQSATTTVDKRRQQDRFGFPLDRGAGGPKPYL